MYILDVIPIARGISKETLSYFTSKSLPPGQVIKVPLRKKTVTAIVTACRSAGEAKSEIRSSEFQIRKIEKVSGATFVLPAFMESAQEAAAYFAGSTGSVLNSLIPKAVIESADKLDKEAAPAAPPAGETNTSDAAPKKNLVEEKFVIQAPDEE